MMPTRVTDLLPQSIAQWFGRRPASDANGSLPADTDPPPEDEGRREEERPAAPPAKRPRYEESTYYAQSEPPTPPVRDPEPVAGPSGYLPEALLPPSRETKEEPRWNQTLSLLGRNRSVARLGLPKKYDDPRKTDHAKKKESPLKPSESPVKQSLTPTGSPFYPGRTMYGGRSASYMNEPNIRERRTAVPSQPLCNMDNSISHSTRRIMSILERSTPTFERRSPQVKTGGNETTNLSNTSLTGRSFSSFNNSKTQELHISHLPTLLKLKQGAKLRESTRAARHIANSNSPGFTPYTAVATAPAVPAQTSTTQEINATPAREWPKQTNKIKSHIGQTDRRAAQNTMSMETVAPLNLPEATLNIDTANLPKFSFGIPLESKKSEKVSKPEIKSSGYKFSLPESVTENHVDVPSDMNNFKFSKPVEVSEKKVTNGPFTFGITKTTEVRSTVTTVTKITNEKSSKGWQCKDCWVFNKDEDLKCVACTGPKPVNKAEIKNTEIVKDWQCKDCWVFNKNNDVKCIACGGSKSSDKNIIENKNTEPFIVKQTKEWRCNDCWVQNKDDVQKCVACGGSKPGAKPEAEKKDWQCRDCWVFNKDNIEKCIACGGSKPASKLIEQSQTPDTHSCTCLLMKDGSKCPFCQKHKPKTATAFDDFLKNQKQSQKKEWTCNDCWVNNVESAQKCVACGGPNPTKKTEQKIQTGFSELVKKQTELWECPCCLTRNNNSLSKCVCCEATRPGSKKNEDTSFNFSATPAFKFGIPANAVSEKPKVEEKPKEIESNNNNTPKTVTFTFGVPKPVEGNDKKDEVKEPPKFSFGAPTAVTEKTAPAFKLTVPDPSKTMEKPKDTSKSELDGTPTPVTLKKDTGLKLPTMTTPTSLFTFNAPKAEELKSDDKTKEISKTAPTLPSFGIPTAKSSESALSNSAPTLFGTPSTTVKPQTTSLFGSSTAKSDAPGSTNSNLFGFPPAKNESPKTGTLFGVSPASSLTGIPPAKATETMPATKVDLFPAQGSFTAPKNEPAQNTSQPGLFTFGSNTQANAKPTVSRFNFSLGGAPSEPTPTFNSSFGSNQKPPAYGATTQSTPMSAFGAPTTQASTLPSFASLPTQANPSLPTLGSSTTQPNISAPTFGSLTTQLNAPTPGFGSLTTQAKPPTPAFGSLTTQANAPTPAFGSLTTQANAPTPAFGSLTTQANAPSPAFGSLTTQARVPMPTFGSLTTQVNPPPAFGTPTTQASSLSSSFGAPSTNMFMSPTQGSLFGSNTQPANVQQNAKPFSFGGSTLFASQNQTTNVFGSNQANPTTELFSNPSSNMFNAQPANPAPMGMFGSSPSGFGSTSIPGLGQSQPTLGQPQSSLGQQVGLMGQQAAPIGQTSAFSFGSPSAAPVYAFGQQQPVPQPAASMFNFGGAAGQNVQFTLGSSAGTPQAPGPARKLRKAVRRSQR